MISATRESESLSLRSVRSVRDTAVMQQNESYSRETHDTAEGVIHKSRGETSCAFMHSSPVTIFRSENVGEDLINAITVLAGQYEEAHFLFTAVTEWSSTPAGSFVSLSCL